jgi:mono/diheme cytochrome c family protein
MRTALFAAITAIVVPASQAAEKPADLKRGQGLDKVVAHCSGCHSLDYIPMNGPFLDRAGWNAEVAKMINAFGAPIDQADAKVIAEYLETNYGLQPQAAAAGAAKGNTPRPKHPVSPKHPDRGISAGGDKVEAIVSDGECWQNNRWYACRK